MGKVYFKQIKVTSKTLSQASERWQKLQRGGQKITERDEKILDYLRHLRMLTLEQMRRLAWPGGTTETARRRMTQLISYKLLTFARRDEIEPVDWHLPIRAIYTLDLTGLIGAGVEEFDKATVNRHTITQYVLFDILLAEIFVRVHEATKMWRGRNWDYDWLQSYPKDPSLLLLPAALIILYEYDKVQWAGYVHLYLGQDVLALKLIEEHPNKAYFARLVPEPLADTLLAPLVQQIRTYSGFYQNDHWRQQSELGHLDQFPNVLIVVRDEAMIEPMRDVIEHYRIGPVHYLLTTWDHLLQTSDFLTLPVQSSQEPVPNWRPLTHLPMVRPPSSDEMRKK